MVEQLNYLLLCLNRIWAELFLVLKWNLGTQYPWILLAVQAQQKVIKSFCAICRLFFEGFSAFYFSPTFFDSPKKKKSKQQTCSPIIHL